MLVLLIILIFIYHIGAAIYYAQGVEPLPTFEFLYHAAFLCGVVWMLRAETKRSAVTSIYCQGMLVGIGWLIIIPYHLLTTRGVKGLIPVFALLGSFLIARIFIGVFYLVASGQLSN
jgi:hypothetical protein